jgi:hypothetical protein
MQRNGGASRGRARVTDAKPERRKHQVIGPSAHLQKIDARDVDFLSSRAESAIGAGLCL